MEEAEEVKGWTFWGFIDTTDMLENIFDVNFTNGTFKSFFSVSYVKCI